MAALATHHCMAIRLAGVACAMTVLAASAQTVQKKGDAARSAPIASAAQVAETLGTTYEIKEPSLFEQFQKWLEAKRASGELAKIEQEAVARSKNSINNPAPVAGLTIARVLKQWDYDPAIVAVQDVRDHEGRLIVAKGARVSPLRQMSWRPMIFIDARDTQQIDYAKRQMQQWNGRGKAVLVAGSWQEVAKAWGEHVYYDQAGTLTKRFGIGATPATVVQAGEVLRVSEVPANSIKVQQ
jgi:conjugal transfer pilus assembly protein TraW